MHARLIQILLVLLLPWSCLVQAQDADTFVQADSAAQASLLENWAAHPEADRLPWLQALNDGRLGRLEDKAYLLSANGWVAVDGGAVAPTEPDKLRLNNRLRGLLNLSIQSLQLSAADAQVRLAAAQALQSNPKPALLPLIRARLTQETDAQIKDVLTLAQANLELQDPDPKVRLTAVRQLGESNQPQVATALRSLLEAGQETDPEFKTALQTSLTQVERRLWFGEVLGEIFSGLSLGSILLLAALGLAITFGLLGVINMAHGEMLMIGAYTTYMVQNLMQAYLPEYLSLYPLVALPVAFLVTALVGMVLERTVIRFLYGRPLETLLATLGISLILIQGVKTVFGSQNVTVANPAWLSGSIQLLPNLALPYNRIAIILFALGVVALTWLLLNKTRLGLNVRAVTQNRNMAACCGVPTGRVDMFAFGLGSGIAGLGGVALSQIGNVGPELGQGYIIDSFLVVVVGGVGQMAGTLLSAFGLGVFNKLLETQIDPVLGKILILCLIILFIQKRPQGLFAFKGRVID